MLIKSLLYSKVERGAIKDWPKSIKFVSWYIFHVWDIRWLNDFINAEWKMRKCTKRLGVNKILFLRAKPMSKKTLKMNSWKLFLTNSDLHCWFHSFEAKKIESFVCLLICFDKSLLLQFHQMAFYQLWLEERVVPFPQSIQRCLEDLLWLIKFQYWISRPWWQSIKSLTNLKQDFTLCKLFSHVTGC